MAAYMLAICNITNPKPEMKEYAQKSGALAIKHGAKYLLRGKPMENYEGDILEGKVVILTEFPTMDDLQSYIKGDEYRSIKHLREGTGEYHIAFYEAPATP